MVNRKKGTPFEIATQGISSPDGIGIATQGFIEPILGDLILGGSADVVFNQGAIVGAGGLVLGGSALVNRTYIYLGSGGLITGGEGFITISPRYVGSGGLTIGGAADVTTSIVPTVGGNVSLGGAATVTKLFNIFPQGGLVLGGDATEYISYNVLGSGGLTIDGAGTISVTYNPGVNGGLVTGGGAGIDSNIGPKEFGRGGARSTRRVPRLPNTTFEFPIFNPDDYLQPMDYLKKIQDVLDKAEREKLEQFKYLSQGTIKITGRGKVTVVYRDQPDGEMYVANNPPLEPIILDLPSVFSQGQTAIEIAELEDHLLLHDLFGLGDYEIKKGPKARYIHQKKKTTGGEAQVKFISGASTVRHVNMRKRRQQMEDDELLLGINKKRMMSRQERDEEELRLLGFLD